MHVQLMPVDDKGYCAWMNLSVGVEAALLLRRMLPDLRQIEGQRVRAIVDADSGSQVGYAWYESLEGISQGPCSLFHLVIREEHRKKGYGTAALAAIEEDLRQAGVASLEIEVGDRDQVARALLRARGFEDVAVRVRKKL